MKNRIFTINDWWGGPLCGVCEFIGEKYIYQRRFDEELDMYTNDYFLTPIYDEQFETIINDWHNWLELYNSGRENEYIRSEYNNINEIAENQSLYQFCVKTGKFIINDHFNSNLENSWVEWTDSDYTFPETFTGIIAELYNCYYEYFTWMFISDNKMHFIDQLKKEITPGHDLYGIDFLPELKNDMNDDVIYSCRENEIEIFCLIHLTYSNYNDINFPQYKRIGDLKALKEYLESTIEREYLE